MDERLRHAAQSGNIDALYDLIEDDADVLRRIDEMEFVDTPLHIAAAQGHTEFAMELMNLKPSFARKLNQRGLSPIHLALQKKQEKMVDDLLSIDKDLVRVKGREGYTPLHHAVREGNVPLLSKFLEHCPNCILDLTIRKETALHIAAQNNHLEAFKAILRRLPTVYEAAILNLEDKDGNTVLHIAASNNQHQMIKLLIKSQKIDWNKVNQSGFTALHVLEAQAGDDRRENVNMLKRAKVPPSIFLAKMVLQSRRFTEIITDILEMKTDTINTLLVVLALILSMTYQAVLSPPAGARDAGKSFIKHLVFFSFYAFNSAAFSLAWLLTLMLVTVVAKSIIILLLLLYLMMACCYAVAYYTISPNLYVSFGADAVAVGAIIAVLFYCYFYFRPKNL